MVKTNTTSLTIKSMWCKTLILFLQNVQSARQEALLFVFEDNEAVIKMIMKGRSPTMRHVSRTHRVALYWLFDRINLDPKSKSNTSTPKTNSHTSWQRGISHVMTGIICWPCLISAILALLPASQRWRNELNKIQEKNVSQQNRDPWWIWPQERLRSCLLQPHQYRGGPRMDIKILENLFQVTIEQGNLWKRQDQIIHKRMMVDLGLLKSGKVELRSTIDRGNLRVFRGMHCKNLTLIVRNLFSAETRTLQGTESWFTIERWNLCHCISKNRLILKILSWAVTQQNLWTKSKTKCETDRKECRTLQSQVKSIQ